VRLNPDDPAVLWTAAIAMSILNREHERALDLTSRSVALNPSSSMAWAVRGWALAFLGRGNEAIECFKRAERLSPLDPLAWFFHGGIGAGHLHERRYEEAIHWWERTLRENPGFVGGLRSLAAAYAYLGRIEEATD
jgi:adenylate cyclase